MWAHLKLIWQSRGNDRLLRTSAFCAGLCHAVLCYAELQLQETPSVAVQIMYNYSLLICSAAISQAAS